MWGNPRAARAALAGVILYSCAVSQVALAVPPEKKTFRPHAPVKYYPPVYAYDLEKDEPILIESSVAPAPSRRPGGKDAYYGNRLQEFRYLGNPKQGGIYQALSEYQEQRQLDPQKYQYRLMLPTTRVQR